MISAVSVFHCTLMFINPERLFQGLQDVEWFVPCWMIFSYDVEYILYVHVLWYLNTLYYVKWFALSWIICNVFWLRLKICTVVDWFQRFKETSSWEIISSGKLPQNFLFLENLRNDRCHIRKAPLRKFLLLKLICNK